MLTRQAEAEQAELAAGAPVLTVEAAHRATVARRGGGADARSGDAGGVVQLLLLGFPAELHQLPSNWGRRPAACASSPRPKSSLAAASAKPSRSSWRCSASVEWKLRATSSFVRRV